MATRVLLLSSLKEHTGNFSWALRVRNHLDESGMRCELVDIEPFSDSQEFKRHAVLTSCDCVIGIHAYRSGRLLLDCPVPFCLVFGGTDVNEFYKTGETKLPMEAAVMKAKYLVCFNKSMADQALSIWPEVSSRLCILPPEIAVSPSRSFDLHDFLNKTCGIPEKSDIFLLVAGLRPVKDPLYLAPAFSEWHTRHRSSYFVIMGPCLDAEFSQSVRKVVNSMPGVLLVDALPHPECHKAMQDATAVVNSSLSEGMSTAILEAMELGVPVMARSIPANQAIVTHKETGLLFDTPQEFIDLAEELLRSPEVRSSLIRSAKGYVKTHHSAQGERARYEELVKGMVSEVAAST